MELEIFGSHGSLGDLQLNRTPVINTAQCKWHLRRAFSYGLGTLACTLSTQVAQQVPTFVVRMRVVDTALRARLNHFIFSLKVFGLHSNADITYQTKTTSDVLETIVNIQPKDSSGGSGETRESLVARQATEMLEKLPADYVPFEVWILLQFICISYTCFYFLPHSGPSVNKLYNSPKLSGDKS